MKQLFIGLLLICASSQSYAATTESCSKEGSIRSAAGSLLNIQFKNSSNQTIKVHWLNASGMRVHYKKLSAGAKYNQSTFVNHAWLITDSNNKCIKIISLKSGDKTVDTTESDFQSTVNADRLIDWAEDNYPQLFAPARSATLKSGSEWVYRTYADTNTAIGVKNSDRVFVTGGTFSKFGTLVDVGRFADLLAAGPDKPQSINGELSFNRVVATLTGIGAPEAALNFKKNQTVAFVWKEKEFITIGGVRFNFISDGGSAWNYTRGTPPSISSVLVFKDLQTKQPASISLTVVDNSNFMSPIFVSYTFNQ